MQIVDNKAVLLNLREPSRVTDVIPKSKLVNGHKVLVHWGVDEARILKNLDIDCPSPITKQYRWTGMHVPFKHQKVTSDFLTMNRRAYVFSEQGTGKTASAIWAADFLLSKRVVKRVLVLCPLSIMNSAWRDDLFAFAMHRTVTVAYGPAAKRKALVEQNSEFVIINYDGVAIVQEEIRNGGFDLIIVDEGNFYKNANTDRWKTLSALIQPHTWVWLMTGTPAAQGPTDAYGLAKLLNRNSVPGSFVRFRDQVMYKVSNFKWLPKIDSKDTVHRVLQPAIRFTKDECLDLPKMMYTKRIVDLSAQQKKYYNKLKSDMVMNAAGEQVTAANAAVNLNKLLQISCGAVYSDEGETLEFDITTRYKVLKEVIEETSQKVLVFAPFKHVIRLLTKKLNEDGIATDFISGEVSVNKRTDIFKRFQEDDNPRVLVIQPQAASHGVTLTAANAVVWWGPVPSLETYAQANARVHRPGQLHKSTVIQLQGSFAEKHVYSLLDSKLVNHKSIIELYNDILA